MWILQRIVPIAASEAASEAVSRAASEAASEAAPEAANNTQKTLIASLRRMMTPHPRRMAPQPPRRTIAQTSFLWSGPWQPQEACLATPRVVRLHPARHATQRHWQRWLPATISSKPLICPPAIRAATASQSRARAVGTAPVGVLHTSTAPTSTTISAGEAARPPLARQSQLTASTFAFARAFGSI